MKIVYCIHSTSNSGGMERVLSNKVNYWVNNGHDVTVITTDQMNKPRFFHFDTKVKFFDLGVNYQGNNGKSIWIKTIQYPGKLIKNRRRLKRILSQIRPDIVVSMFDNDAMILPFINDGSKKVLEIHFSKYWRISRRRTGLWGIVDRLRTYLDSMLIRRFDHFVVLTNEDRALWSQTNKISVIPNALTFDSDDVSPLNTKRVLAVGRYDFQKNFEELISIWAMISDKNPSWRLTIIGDGSMRSQLEKQIKDLGLQHSITLEKPSKNMEMWYLDSSIYVMTSRYEGLPMVLLEAQSMGLPIVSYACQCGPRDIINDGDDGYLVPINNKEVFAYKLNELMNSRELLCKFGKNAKNNSARFNEESIMNRWKILFEDLIR